MHIICIMNKSTDALMNHCRLNVTPNVVTFIFPVQKALYNVGFKTAEELQDTVNKLTVSIQRAKAKILGVELPPEEPQEVCNQITRTSY